MKYTFVEKELTLHQANRFLAVMWGTIDDDRIHEDQLPEFIKDRIELYSKLGTKVAITLSVEPIQ